MVVLSRYYVVIVGYFEPEGEAQQLEVTTVDRALLGAAIKPRGSRHHAIEGIISLKDYVYCSFGDEVP